MAPRKEISIDVRNLIIKYRNEKKSFTEISKILNISRATVQTITNKFKNTGCIENKPRSGRPKKISRRDESFIVKEVNKNPNVNASILAKQLAERSDTIVHPRTIQRTLNSNGFRTRTPSKKPLISEKNRKLRLEFAQKHKDKGLDEMNSENQSLNDLLYESNSLTEEEEYLDADINELGGRNYSIISTNESSGEENLVHSDESDFDESDNEPLANIRFREYLDETPEELLDESEPELESSAIGPNRGEKYVGQGRGNNTVWWSQSDLGERIRSELAEMLRSHSLQIAKKQYMKKIDVFKDIFPNNLVETIALETNKKAKRVYAESRNINPQKSLRYWHDTNADEIYAYIAILLHAGAEKSNLVQAKELFDKKNMPFYRAVMALYRFEQLSRFLRFDDSETRVDRLRHDKLAPIRHIWTIFQSSMKMHYQPSKELCIDEKKKVLVLSSARTRKPEVIHDYNTTKGGVDTFDKMVRGYSCERKSNRWPMAIFFNMVDAAALAAYRLFELSHPAWNSNKSQKRKFFLKELAMDLAENHLKSKNKVTATTRIAMDLIGFRFENFAQPRFPVAQTNIQKQRCEQCKKQKKDNKTTAVCDLCATPMCTKHYIRTCEPCYQRKFIGETDSDTDDDDNRPTTSAAARQRARTRRH